MGPIVVSNSFKTSHLYRQGKTLILLKSDYYTLVTFFLLSAPVTFDVFCQLIDVPVMKKVFLIVSVDKSDRKIMLIFSDLFTLPYAFKQTENAFSVTTRQMFRLKHW